MRVAVSLLPLLLVSLPGCLDGVVAPVGADLDDLDVYRYVYPVSEKHVPGADHGWLFRLGNPANQSAVFDVGAYGVLSAQLGPATEDGWRTTPPAQRFVTDRDAAWGGRVTVPAGGSVALLVNVQTYGEGPTGLVFVRSDGQVRDVPVAVAPDEAGPDVEPGDHVRTVTVGVWVNGTSFYTNSPSLLDDPHFPAGGNIDRAEARADAEPLPVYVYGADRSEQPQGSKDTCHFTTIDGYNALLRSQLTGSTGVRFLAPEEAYTSAGAEDHFLYGDALVFLNTVVAHDGSTGPTDDAPNPQGACFDAEGYVPPVPPLTAASAP